MGLGLGRMGLGLELEEVSRKQAQPLLGEARSGSGEGLRGLGLLVAASAGRQGAERQHTIVPSPNPR